MINRPEKTVSALELGHVVVHEVDGINPRYGFVNGVALFHTVGDGPARIGSDAVGVVCLSSTLHFNNDVIVACSLTIEVEPDSFFVRGDPNLASWEEGDINDDPCIVGDKGVEEAYQDVLVTLCGHQSLEAKIRKWIDDGDFPLGNKFFCYLDGYLRRSGYNLVIRCFFLFVFLHFLFF